jgi:hypothetical protein
MRANASDFEEFRRSWILQNTNNAALKELIKDRFGRDFPVEHIFEHYCWSGIIDIMLDCLDKYVVNRSPRLLSYIRRTAQNFRPTDFTCLVLATEVKKYELFLSRDLGARRVEVAKFLDVELYEEI